MDPDPASDPAAGPSYVHLFSQPLIAFPDALSGQSSGVADLPLLWPTCLDEEAHSTLPFRFSDNKDLIQQLANNFRAFAARMPFPPGPEVCKSYQACTGPWTSEQQTTYLPDDENCSEQQISTIHIQILLPLVTNLFNRFVQNHPACTTLKDNNVTLSFNRSAASGRQHCGVVDHVICVEIPDRQPKFKRCLWFDHKNPAVLSTHHCDIERLAAAGHRLNWKNSKQIPAKTLLRKGAYYSASGCVLYGLYSSWQHILIMKTVLPPRGSPPQGSPYLACSAVVVAGTTDSADVIPAILCIAFETCQRLGLITDYPLVETLLTPETPTAVGVDLDSDAEDQTPDSCDISDSPTIDDDGSYRPDSGSSDYSSPEPKRKRCAKRVASIDTQSKKTRSENDKQLTILTSCDYHRVQEKYTLNENHLPDHLCPIILYVKELLGSGGTGSVYATSDPDGRLFVVKISQGAQRHILLHESNIYRALELLDFEIAFIPRYFGFFSHPDFDVIVMEHTGSAIQHISHLSFSDRHIILKHCRALHGKGFVYEDLRASNITRNYEGVLKLVDMASVRKGYCRHRRQRQGMLQRVRDPFCVHVLNWAKVLGLTVA